MEGSQITKTGEVKGLEPGTFGSKLSYVIAKDFCDKIKYMTKENKKTYRRKTVVFGSLNELTEFREEYLSARECRYWWLIQQPLPWANKTILKD